MFNRGLVLLCNKLSRGTVAVADATCVDVASKLHLAEFAGGFEARQQLLNGITHWAIMAVHFSWCTGCEGENKLFAFELVTSAAMREAMLEGLFHPAL